MKIISDHRKIDKSEWAQFVYEHPHGNIFQTPEMFQVYDKTANYKPVVHFVMQNNEIRGVLTGLIQKEHKGLLGFFSSRCIIFGGPLVENDNPELIEELLKVHNKKVRGKSIYTQIRNLWVWRKKDYFVNSGFSYEDHLDIIMDITKSEDKLWDEMHRTRRKGIRKAFKKGLSVKEINIKIKENLEKCFLLIEDVYRRVKIPYPNFDFFLNASEILAEKNMILSMGAYLKDELIGIRLVLSYKSILYDWYAGAKNEYLNFRPNDILPWEIIKWGIEKGFKYFDFGGVGKPGKAYGVREYKKKFGGEFVNYGRFENIHHPIVYKLVKNGFKIWKRLK